MPIIEINEDNFEKVISDNEIILIYFWASWCIPCKRFTSIFKTASELDSEITFAKCNIEKNESLAISLGIKSIPTTIFFQNCEITSVNTGVLPEAKMKKLIKQAKEKVCKKGK